jgi:hypothetical protein
MDRHRRRKRRSWTDQVAMVVAVGSPFWVIEHEARGLQRLRSVIDSLRHGHLEMHPEVERMV